jgi:hypothetical protein
MTKNANSAATTAFSLVIVLLGLLALVVVNPMGLGTLVEAPMMFVVNAGRTLWEATFGLIF